MSTFTDLQEKAASVLGASNTQVTQGISQIIDECGGMDGLMKRFSDKGLGDVAQSWVSNSANKPITADQVRNVVGVEVLQRIATKVGMTPEGLSQQVATYLPLLVDKLSPHGRVPESWWSRSVEKAKEFFGMKH